MSSAIDSLVEEYADLVSLDRDGQVVLVVHAYARDRDGMLVGDGIRTEPFFWFRDANKLIAKEKAITPFGMLVFLDKIDIYRHGISDREGPSGGAFTLGMDYYPSLNTADVFSNYDPDFHKKKVYHTYLTILADLWLRDLAYHWKTARPPGSDTLEEIGLLRLLEGGTTKDARSVE